MEGQGFPRTSSAVPRDSPTASPSGNPSEPCQPSENPVHPSYFTQINPIYSLHPKGDKMGWQSGLYFVKLPNICTKSSQGFGKHLMLEKACPLWSWGNYKGVCANKTKICILCNKKFHILGSKLSLVHKVLWRLILLIF